MYDRGEEVVVEGHGGRRAVLTVWEDRGAGLSLSSPGGYLRLLAGDVEAPLVGFPKGDVLGRARAVSPAAPSEPAQPPARSLTDAQD